MIDARRAVSSGLGHGTVCTADSQIRGRGRISGRRWVDDGGGALLFTLVLHKSCIKVSYPPTQLLALALCRRMEKGFGLSPRIKWPNDVLVAGAKIAGIIVEMEGDYLLAGMGVNLLQKKFPSDLRSPAISLEQAIFRDSSPEEKNPQLPVPSPSEELLPLLKEIEAHIEESPDIGEIEARIYGLREAVTVRLGDPSRGEVLNGTLSGLKDDGALLITSGDGNQQAIYSGEIEVFSTD